MNTPEFLIAAATAALPTTCAGARIDTAALDAWRIAQQTLTLAPPEVRAYLERNDMTPDRLPVRQTVALEEIARQLTPA